MESGSWAGDDPLEPIRPGKKSRLQCIVLIAVNEGGVMILGQDQDTLRGGYNPRQSWSGAITQVNLWDFSIEKWDDKINMGKSIISIS